MLIQFIVENFLSFKERTVFSFLASKDETHPAHVVSHEKPLRRRLVKAGALYGANASGKSNLIKAIHYARQFILEGSEPNKPLTTAPFKLVSKPNPNSRFQFDFLYKEIEYSYGFTVNASRVVEEFLYANEKGREAKYFERVTSEALKTEVSFGSRLTQGNRKKAGFLRYKAEDTRPNQLLFTNIFTGNLSSNIAEFLPVWEWLFDVLTIIDAEATIINLIPTLHRETPLQEYTSQLLSSVDTGIIKIKLKQNRGRLEHFPELPQNVKERIITTIGTPEGKQLIEIRHEDSPLYIVASNGEGEITKVELLLQHVGEDGKHFEFHLNEESDGTQRLLHLSPMLSYASNGEEKVYIIDELDRRLHPHLSRLLVQTMLQCKGNAQLLFTTHDTNLLDLELLRRDEIWFVEKDKEGGSHLYSLAEFKIRPDVQVEKGYLNGRFGAIPYLGDLRNLGLPMQPPHEEKEPAHA